MRDSIKHRLAIRTLAGVTADNIAALGTTRAGGDHDNQPNGNHHEATPKSIGSQHALPVGIDDTGIVPRPKGDETTNQQHQKDTDQSSDDDNAISIQNDLPQLLQVNASGML